MFMVSMYIRVVLKALYSCVIDATEVVNEDIKHPGNDKNRSN